MNQDYSRPIHVTGSESTTNKKVLDRATSVACLSVQPGSDDVVVKFKDGNVGQVLWEIEADNASGSRSDSFPKPLLFPNGIYIDVDTHSQYWSVNVAVLEPKSSGT